MDKTEFEYKVCPRCNKNKMLCDWQINCFVCHEEIEDSINFEDFDDPDEYYHAIFNGDFEAALRHKELLGDWYGMAPRAISNAFAQKYGLGTAADHARRVMANPKAHRPADLCTTNAQPVRINGQKYKSLRSWAVRKYAPDKVEYAIHRMRRKLFENGGRFRSNHKAARDGGIYEADLLLDETIPWSDRHQSYGDVR